MPGRHFLQIPGPTNIPSAILAALARETIDHRSQEFSLLSLRVFSKLQRIVGTQGPVVIYPSSGTGAWEAALANCLSPGDKVLIAETGYFSNQWCLLARRLGFQVQVVPGDWRRAAEPEAIGAALDADTHRAIKAVAVIHNETSTGALTNLPLIRSVMNDRDHPALLLVDNISSLASTPYLHDEWGVDVTIGCSQKGLQLPPGIGINAMSSKALVAHGESTTPRSYWDWSAMIEANEKGFFPYTPPTNMICALDVATDILLKEGLDKAFQRHARHAAATQAAAHGWGLEIQCVVPEQRSPSVTALRVPEDFDADDLRRSVLETYDTSLGSGLGPLRGRVFRIGHLGSMNDSMLLGALGAIDSALTSMRMVSAGAGVAAAVDSLTATNSLPGA